MTLGRVKADATPFIVRVWILRPVSLRSEDQHFHKSISLGRNGNNSPIAAKRFRHLVQRKRHEENHENVEKSRLNSGLGYEIPNA
jgi:hypothetical protein